jgi:hypothetical protein
MSFITNDQKAAIGGEGSFSFVTTIGSGIEKVDVTMSYEYDYEGIYNTCIESVTFQGVDVCGCLTEETLSALEMEAIAKRETQLKDDYYA